MEYHTLQYDVVNKVGRISLDRPAYKNAQSRRLLEELDDAFARADRDHGVNVIALFGEGDHFSAGHDLGTPDELADREARPWPEGIRGWYGYTHETFYANTLRWRNLETPTIAGVHGYCIFGGWMIASAMDVIFAARSALFLGSLFQYFSMPWDLPPRKVKELLFESRFIDAEEAAVLGLVNQVVPDAELKRHTLEWAERVALNDPFALRMAKATVNNAEDTKGFQAHLKSAHAFYCLSRLSRHDPDALEVESGERRLPMVKVALDNYQRQMKAKREGSGS